MGRYLRNRLGISIILFFFVSGGIAYPQQSSPVSEPVSGVGQGVTSSSVGVSQVGGSVATIKADRNPYNITVPEEFGDIGEVFQGAENSPLVVHIQNVHANYEAQMNIKGILNHLAEQYHFSLIQLEGAVSKLDPAILQPSYLKEANLKLVDFLMREGRITGADAFAVETDKPVELYGIEDYSLYMENLRMFKAIYGHQAEMKPYFDGIHRLIQNIGPKLFNAELLDFTRKTEEFSGEQIDFLDYLVYLNTLAEKYQLTSLDDLKEMVQYPNLVRIMRLHSLERELNKSGLKKETEALKLEFQKKMPGSEQVEKILSRLDQNEKGVTPRSYFLELTQLAKEAKIDFVGYPAFRIFAEFLIHQDEIDHRGVFSELKQFERFLQEKLFVEEDQKTFLELIDFAGLLEQYFRLEMSREKLALYLKNRDQIKPSQIWIRLGELAQKYSVSITPLSDVKKLDSHMDELEYFYQLVLKRDEVFIEKILSKMQSLGQDKTILVTGGFHKDGLMDRFRKENISYVIINPKVDVKEGSENYLKVMLEEDAVVGSVFAGTFALEIGTYLNNALRSGIQNYNLAVAIAATEALTRALNRESTEKSFIDRVNAALSRYRAVVDSQIIARAKSAKVIDGDNVGVLIETAVFLAGEKRQFQFQASFNSRTGNFTVTPKEVPVSEEFRNLLSRPPDAQQVSTRRVDQAGLPTLVTRAIVEKPFANARPTPPKFSSADNFVLGEFVPLPGILTEPSEREFAEDLLSLPRPAIAKAAAELRTGAVLDLKLIRDVHAATGVPVVTPDDLGKAGLIGAEQELFDALHRAAVPATEQFLVLVLDTKNQPEAGRAELRALAAAVRLNEKMAVAVYGVGVEDFAAGALEVDKEALKAGPLNRILFVSGEKGVPISSFKEAVEQATRHLNSKFGILLNHLLTSVKTKPMSPDEFMKITSVLVPAGDIGNSLRDSVAQRWPEALQVLGYDLNDPSVASDRGLVEAVVTFEVNVLSRLRDVNFAALLRDLGEEAIKQVGPNQYQISGTAAALQLIKRLYDAYVRIAIAA